MSFVANRLTCFDNFIVLDANCSGTLPSSGIYGSRAGITRSYLSQIITKDFRNEEHFFNEKLQHSIDTVCNDVYSTFQNKYKAVSVVNNFRTGQFQENKVEIAGGAYYKGLLFNIFDETSALDLFLSEISLFVKKTGTVDLKIIDLIQGKIIDSIPVTTTTGEISTIFPLEKIVGNSRKQQIFIGYDATAVTSYKTIVNNSTCSGCSDTLFRNSYEVVGAYRLPMSGNLTFENLTAVSDTGGLSIVHSLQCNHAAWLCSISNLLSYPILYKTAALIHEFALTVSPNTRFNTTEGVNSELIQKALDMAELKYREWMDNKIRSIKVPNDSTCFECYSPSRHVIVMP